MEAIDKTTLNKKKKNNTRWNKITTQKNKQQKTRFPIGFLRNNSHDHHAIAGMITKRQTTKQPEAKHDQSNGEKRKNLFKRAGVSVLFCHLFTAPCILYFNLIILFDFAVKFNALFHTFGSHFIAFVCLSVFVCFVLCFLYCFRVLQRVTKRG